MEKIYEAIDSITKRLGNPFLISFALSWLVANWKAVIVILSKEDYKTKFAFIEGMLYAPETNPDWRLVWLPLIASAIYVLCVPFLVTIATVVGGLYDNLNEWAKAFVLKTRILTLKQSKDLRAEMEATFNKLTEENQVVSTARIDATNKAGAQATAIFQLSLPHVFRSLQHEAQTWSTPVEKMPSNKLSENLEFNDLATNFGLPKAWLKIFSPNENMLSFSLVRASKLYELDESETMEVLIKLAAVGMIDFQWADDQFRFLLRGGRWGDYLNGRPA